MAYKKRPKPKAKKRTRKESQLLAILRQRYARGKQASQGRINCSYIAREYGLCHPGLMAMLEPDVRRQMTGRAFANLEAALLAMGARPDFLDIIWRPEAEWIAEESERAAQGRARTREPKHPGDTPDQTR